MGKKNYNVSNIQGSLAVVRYNSSEAYTGRIKNIVPKVTWSTPKNKIAAQQIRLCVNNVSRDKTGIYANLGKGTTSWQYDLSYNLVTGSLTDICVYIGTKPKKKLGNWQSKAFKIYAPGIPVMAEPSVDTTNYDACTFSWSQNPNDNDVEKLKGLNYSFLDCYQWETRLSNSASPELNNESAWASGKTASISIYDPSSGAYVSSYGYGTSTSTSIKIHETQATITDGKYRHIRVRALGPGGVSAWVSRSYRFGNKTAVSSSKTDITNSTNDDTSGTQEVSITGAGTYEIQAQHAIVVPRVVATTVENGKTFTLNLPLNYNSWETHKKLTGTSTGDNALKEKLAFNFSGAGDDEAVFLRTIAIQNGEEIVVVDPALMNRNKGLPYTLPTPRLTLGTPSEATHRVEVTIAGTRSTVENSIVAIYYRTDSTSDGEIIDIFGLSDTTKTVQAPDWGDATPEFGAKALVADYTYATTGNITKYTLGKIHMASGIDWKSSSLPKRPSKPVLTNLGNGRMHVKFDWPWTEANKAELSWSDNPDAWMSTDAPSTYELSNVNEGEWIITGLSAGTWYVKVRLFKTTDETTIYGPYSEMSEQTMSSAPVTPVLSLVPESPSVAKDDTITAYWGYESTDGTSQMETIFAEATLSNGQYTYSEFEKPRVTSGATSLSFKPTDFGWTGGEHLLAVRTRSSSNILSKDWSYPKKIIVAPKPTITNVSFKYDNNVAALTGTDKVLTKLPLYVTMTGGGDSGNTTIVIERAQDFNPRRPTGDIETLFAGEAVYLTDPPIENGTNTRTITIDRDNFLIGALDDEAEYYIRLYVKDSYGQSVEYSPDNPVKFRVKWSDQALVPSAFVSFDSNQNQATLRPIAPSGATNGATCDIYRNSLDGFSLIKSDATFGNSYLDVYPTLGYNGGYRFVYKNIYGDYKTATNEFAWKDVMPYRSREEALADLREEADDPTAEFIEGYDYYIYEDSIDRNVILIDYDTEELRLTGNIAISNAWKKDFQLTRYLGGSMVGDWNPGVERTGSYTAVIPVVEEEAEVVRLRALADYAGACRVRTLEGSNFFANVEVTDAREEKWVKKLSKVTLSITRVDEEEDTIDEAPLA